MSRNSSETNMMKQYTRITFNTNNWERPSGNVGKSKSPNTFEGSNYFGFEEWLFDQSTLINGKKYGFIQGIAASTQKRENPIELILYTINSITRQRLHVVSIKKWNHFIDENDQVLNQFKQNGWLKRMRNDVSAINGKVLEFDKVAAKNGTEPLFNICFDFKDLEIKAKPTVFPKNHPVYKLNRFRIYQF